MKASTTLYPVAIAGLMGAIFVADAVTDRNVVVAMFYVAPVVIAARMLPQAMSITVAATCVVLTVVSFAVSESAGRLSTGIANLLITLAVLVITTLLAQRSRAADQRMREQASLLDLTHDSIFVRGMDSVIRYWNRGSEELYGWPAEQAIGRVSHELLATVFPVPLETIEALLLETGHWEGELIQRRRDGSRLIVDSRWALNRDGQGRPDLVMATNNDVTSRRRAEYVKRQVFEVVPDGMCIVDADFRVRRANAAFGRLCAWPGDGLDGKPLAQLMGQELFVRMSEPDLRRCFAGEEIRYARWMELPIGRRYLRVSYSPLRVDPDLIDEALFVVADLTDQALAAEALRMAQAELARVNRVATMGQLSASIAHEVNQPIHAVGLNAKAALRWLALDPPALDEVRDAIARVAQNAARAGDVLARIRALMKRAPQQLDTIDINEAIRDLLALTRNEIDKHGVAVELALSPCLPLVRGDRVELQQVVLNLVMNAVEAMAAGHDTTRRLQITTEADGAGGVRVAVADSGPGVPPEAAQRLFEPFFTTKPEGMGMGLTICRSIVETHGGRLEVSAKQPSGAVFAFTLSAELTGNGGRGEEQVGAL